jgi:hypothetical protein
MDASAFHHAMIEVPTPGQLSELSDEDVAAFALAWRARAAQGDRNAFGVAHALEVEHRRRVRTSQFQSLPTEPPPAPRRWWRLWRR